MEFLSRVPICQYPFIKAARSCSAKLFYSWRPPIMDPTYPIKTICSMSLTPTLRPGGGSRSPIESWRPVGVIRAVHFTIQRQAKYKWPISVKMELKFFRRALICGMKSHYLRRSRIYTPRSRFNKEKSPSIS